MANVSNTLNIPSTQAKRVVVIGCGFGGLATVRSLIGKGFQLVLFDKNNYHTFQPLLYQVATAGLEADSIAYPIRKIFANAKDVFFRWTNVTRIDTGGKKIYTEIGECDYDYLVLATGATTNFFGNENISKNAMPMKSVVESLNLRSLILQHLEKATIAIDPIKKQQLLTFGIVGGGPTGVELAGALCELKNHVLPNDYPELDFSSMNVLLIESGKEILQNMSLENQTKAKKYLEELGAKILFNTRAADFDEHFITTADGEQIPCATLIWAAGIKGDVPHGLAENHFTPSKRILTDDFCRLKDNSYVYVIGDLNCITNEKFPKGYPQVAPLAIQQGEYVAKHIISSLANNVLPAFEYIDKGSMATVGRNRAVVEAGKIKFGGWMGWMAWMAVHLMQLVGFRNRVVVFINWVWNYINYDRNIRLIIRPYKKQD